LFWPLAGAGQRAFEPLFGLIDLVEVAARFRLGMLLCQDLVDHLWREPVDLARRRLAVVGEGVQHPACTTVVSRDDGIATGERVLDIRQIDGLQQMQVGGSHVYVVGRIEQIIPGWLAILALDPYIDIPSCGGRDHLHQAVGIGVADRIGPRTCGTLDE